MTVWTSTIPICMQYLGQSKMLLPPIVTVETSLITTSIRARDISKNRSTMLITNDIHGTACAGVAAAAGITRQEWWELLTRCTILPVKVFGGDGLFPNDRMADAIRYAGQHADVISISWGSAPQS